LVQGLPPGGSGGRCRGRMVRALPGLGNRGQSNAEPVQPLGGNGTLALPGPPAGRGGQVPAGNGALQVYEPSDPSKPSTGDDVRTTSTDEWEREAARKENLALCRKMCIFFVYLIIFTVSMLYEQGKSPARLADHIKASLDGGAVPLLDVTSSSRLYDYMEQSFVPAVFGNTVDRWLAEEMPGSLPPFDFSNRLLGTVRIRQMRVGLQNDCQINPMFQGYSVSCYPSFEPATESTENFGSGGAVYSRTEDHAGTNFPGKFGTYGPHGYMQLLPTNASHALASVAELRRGGFLDAATRAVFLEFNVWSSNVATYAAVTVVLEFGATGGVRQQVNVLTLTEGVLNAGGLGFAADWLAFILVIVVVLFNIYFIVEEAQEIWIQRLAYFYDAWNVLDWINMIMLLVAFVLRIINFVEAGDGIGQQALGNDMSFKTVRGIAYRAHMVSLLHAVNGALLWGKAIKYFRYLPLVKDIIHVVWNAFDLFLPFICMFAVAFVGFAMAYNIGFGDKIWELSTFYSSAVYLGRAFLRDIRLMTVYDLATPLFAATLILLYYVTLILVGASFLFAIIADALFRAKFKTDEKPNPYLRDQPCAEFVRELIRRFPRAFGYLLGCGILTAFYCGICYGACFLCCRRRPAASAGKDQDGAQPDNKANSFASPLKGELVGYDVSSTSSRSEAPPEQLPSRLELMRSVELMSGRILSEIAIVSIEIRSELHEVCERVAQMQMAVEELTHRADKVREEQEVDMY